MRIFGIQIERKTDVLAFAAFLMSVTAATAQVVAFARGADLVLVAPEKVVIFCVTQSGQQWLRVSAPVSYVNKGAAGYNAAVTSERLVAYLKTRKVEYAWSNFETTYPAYDPDDADLTVCGQTPVQGALARRVEGPAAPFPVNAGSAVSHETTFAPLTRRGSNQGADFLPWSTFIEALEEGKQLVLELRASVVGDDDVTARCWVNANNALSNLVDKNWTSQRCWPMD